MPSVAATLAPFEAEPFEPFVSPRAPVPTTAAGATVTRHFSLWPFGTRVLRLFLLCDPTPLDGTLNPSLLRAMQQEYFRSEARSQTNALRSAILAAHYALKERNQDKLAHDRATAAAACAVTRGSTAYVALAGEAAALSWSSGALSMHRAPVRVARPLGAEAHPRVAFWSTSLGPGDRLALVCGAAWKDDSADAAADVLSAPHAAVREHLAMLLAGSDGPARVWVAEGAQPAPARGRLFPSAVAEPARPAAVRQATEDVVPDLAAARPGGTWRKLLAAASALALVSLAVVGGRQVLDWPVHAPQIASQAVATARDWRVANLGPAADHLVDLAVGDGAAYALDVKGQAVTRIPLEGQSTDGGSVAVRRGTSVGRGSLEAPTAIAWIDGLRDGGRLLVLDRARTAVLVSPSGEIHRLELPRSTEWKSVDAIQGGRETLYVLDREAARILAYDQLDASSGPRVRELASNSARSGLRLQDAVDLTMAGDLYLRYVDGSVRRIDSQGRQQPFEVRLPGGPLGPVAGVAPGRDRGLYLLDAQNGRVIEVRRDGGFVRELSLDEPGEIGTARLVQGSSDGQRLVYVDASGVEVIDVPAGSTPPSGGSPG